MAPHRSDGEWLGVLRDLRSAGLRCPAILSGLSAGEAQAEAARRLGARLVETTVMGAALDAAVRDRVAAR